MGISSYPNTIGILSDPHAAGFLSQKVKWSDVPAVVQKTITENAGGGNIEEIGKETKIIGVQMTSIYEVDVRKIDGSKVEIKVGEDGKLIKIDKD